MQRRFYDILVNAVCIAVLKLREICKTESI